MSGGGLSAPTDGPALTSDEIDTCIKHRPGAHWVIALGRGPIQAALNACTPTVLQEESDRATQSPIYNVAISCRRYHIGVSGGGQRFKMRLNFKVALLLRPSYI